MNANPLALVAATQQYPDTHYQAPKPHKTYAASSKPTLSTKSYSPTRCRGKKIAKPITPSENKRVKDYAYHKEKMTLCKQEEKDSKANASITHEINECKSSLEESNNIRDRCKSALHDQEIKLEKYKKYENCQFEKEEVKKGDMVWWGASLMYETGEKKLNEVDLISQEVEMILSFLEKFKGGFEQDIDNYSEEDKRDKDGDGEVS
ncbi:hypothetical protein Tco_1485265 [Tanacetum coccineum]